MRSPTGIVVLAIISLDVSRQEFPYSRGDVVEERFRGSCEIEDAHLDITRSSIKVQAEVLDLTVLRKELSDIFFR